MSGGGVRLRNGDLVPLEIAENVWLTLLKLNREAGDALHEFVHACYNPSYRLDDATYAILSSYKLVLPRRNSDEVAINDAVQAVVRAAAVIQGRMVLLRHPITGE